jgi:phage shock protein PspC (stress-responsive transcriptional regulator)
MILALDSTLITILVILAIIVGGLLVIYLIRRL